MYTWPDIAEMQRALALMLQGNPYFARQQANGKYQPCRDVGRLEEFANDIFAGVKTVGFYAIRPDNLTRWGAIDYDAHGGVGNQHWHDEARRTFGALAPKCAEAWLVESSPDGFHVVMFLPELVPARDVRGMLLDFAPEGVEVFPKQDELNACDPRAKGSLLRFPGKHQLKGTWARFIARQGRISEPERGITAAKPRNGKWEEPSTEGRLRSLYAVTTRGLVITGPGQRFHMMQRLAGRLKGRATENEALWVYTAWHWHFQELIITPLEQSRAAFLTCFRALEPCNVSIPDYPLCAEAEARIARLPKVANVRREDAAEVVRLLLRAKLHAIHKGLPDFFLSNRDIARRLDCGESTASRLRSACVRLGVVRVLRKGHTGWATEFELTTEWQPFCNKVGCQGSEDGCQ